MSSPERAEAVLLGTGAAISSQGRTTTMICVHRGRSSLLIDCGADVVARMQQVGLDVATICTVWLTHEHIDHVGGFPLLYKKLWLSGRQDPLPVYGPPEALDQAARCFATFDTRTFVGLPPVQWHVVDPCAPGAAYTDESWTVHVASGRHGVPSIGLRVLCRKTGRIMTYSSDTACSDAITHLARGSDLLLHEATGPSPGHSTAEQAARTARRAEVGRLVLVHLPPRIPESDLAAARKTFPSLELGIELQSYCI